MRKYRYIIIALIIVVLLGSIFILLFPQQTPFRNQQAPSTTGGPGQPTPTIGEDKNVEKELNLLTNRRPLAASDTDVKARLEKSVGNDGETILTTDEVIIRYIGPADEFQVEIDTVNIEKAKTDAVSWFLAQGMSMDGICKLPLNFFAGSPIRQQGINFVSPLPAGC